MERFKDRAWRLFGIKVPLEKRDQIRARFNRRKKDWNSRKVNGLIDYTIRVHSKSFVENITKDFILLDVLKEQDLAPRIFKFRIANE